MLFVYVLVVMDEIDCCYLIVFDDVGWVFGYVMCCVVCIDGGVCGECVMLFLVGVVVDDNLCIVLLKMY